MTRKPARVGIMTASRQTAALSQAAFGWCVLVSHHYCGRHVFGHVPQPQLSVVHNYMTHFVITIFL